MPYANPFATGALSFGEVVTAVGALGTAAFGLVDATKSMWGGVSRHGLSFLKCMVDKVAPAKDDSAVPAASALTSEEIYATIKANWLNGMALDDQKSVVKALIKLRLNPESAPALATLTGVDISMLTNAARKFTGADAPAAAASAGVSATTVPPASTVSEDIPPLTPQEMNAYSRFDLLLTTSIDRAYQQADQRYRNLAKVYAAVFAVVLAEMGAYAIHHQANGGTRIIYLEGLVVGLFATPLAPIAKDLSSALATAVKAVKAVNG